METYRQVASGYTSTLTLTNVCISSAGDVIVELNGKDLTSSTHEERLELMRSSEDLTLGIIDAALPDSELDTFRKELPLWNHSGEHH